MANTEGLRVNVDTALKAAIEREAARQDRSVNYVIRQALRDYLKKGKR